MTLTETLNKATNAQKERALARVLEGALEPALGALPKRELELLILEALIEIGHIHHDPKVYDLVQKLRITKSRARALIYDRELRRQDEGSLDVMAVTALKRPMLQAQGYAIAMEIENPYLADHIRNRVASLGHVSDGSFSPALIRLSASAAAALVDSYLSADDQKKVKKVLVKAGGHNTSLTNLLTQVIAGAAGAVAGKAGEALVNEGAKLMTSLLDADERKIADIAGRIWATAKQIGNSK